ncbi:MAG: PEP-CTERM sorting domain-containing protein [Betaproteobacteria bacterium]|nr:MAG: PEP-CTERM sorting domain-containing protein [Betaproteobacteria bacterium]
MTGGGSVDTFPGTGQHAISGTHWWRTGANNDFVINFDSPVAAFGFFGIDVGDVGAQLTLTLAGGGAVAIDIPHTVEPGGPGSGQNGSVIYFGYIDEANPFTSATFSNVGDFGDDFGFDDMTIGSVQQVVRVPEPPMLALLALALLGLAFFRRGSATFGLFAVRKAG